jgi:hypothetical protein
LGAAGQQVVKVSLLGFIAIEKGGYVVNVFAFSFRVKQGDGKTKKGRMSYKNSSSLRR